MKSSKNFARTCLLLAIVPLGTGSGCQQMGDWLKVSKHRLFGPEKVVAPPEGSPINPILGSIGPTDRAQDIVPNATFPREGDWEYTDEDYVIGPTDVVDISVLDLFAEGLETVLRRQVSNSGNIDLPLLAEPLLAEGHTKDQLRDAIRDAYSPDVLRDPTVSVTIAARRQNTFSILGSVSRPGTYNILRKDMRLLEALALAGGITQTNIHYIYVIRPKPALRRRGVLGGPTGLRPGQPVTLPPLPPEVGPLPTTQPTTQPTTGPAIRPTGGDVDAALRELGKALPGATTQPATQPATRPSPAIIRLSEAAGEGARTTTRPAPTTRPATDDPDLRRAVRAEKWIYSAGKWIRAPERAAATRPTPEEQGDEPRDPGDPFGWKKVDKSDLARIIAINLKQLRDGDPRMNIVVRDNDVVQVPTLQVGEFYVMGEVLRPGVYSLTGRRITVKMAMAAAGNMTALAWPENSILIRRVGGNQEQLIPLDLEAIFQGRDPDVYLKPNDVVAVGTDVRSTFFAVMRNAFRLTYGFGFIYDRNFDDVRGVTPTSRRFTRW